MARSLFAGRPGDSVASYFNIGARQVYALPADATGAATDVTLTVWDEPDGTQLTDLLAADATTPINEVVVPAGAGQIPEFYGPDGVNVSVYLRDSDGDYQRLDARADDFAEQVAADADRAEGAAASVERDEPGGVAPLDGERKLPEANVPDRLTEPALEAAIAGVVDVRALPRFEPGRFYSAGDMIASNEGLAAAAAYDFTAGAVEDPADWVEITARARSRGLDFSEARFGLDTNGRHVTDVVTTSGSPIITSATASFQTSDVGRVVYIDGVIPDGTTILSRQSATQVTLSDNATASVAEIDAVRLVIGVTSAAVAAALAVAQAGNIPRLLPAGTLYMEVEDAPGNNKDISWLGVGDKTILRPLRDGHPALEANGGLSNSQRQVIGSMRLDKAGLDAPVILAKNYGQIGVLEKITGGGAPTAADSDTTAFIQFGESGSDACVFLVLNQVHFKHGGAGSGTAGIKFFALPHSIRGRDYRCTGLDYPLDTNTATCTGGTDFRIDGFVFEQFKQIRLNGLNATGISFHDGRVEAGSTSASEPWFDLSGYDATYKMRGVGFHDVYFSGIDEDSVVVKARNVAGLTFGDDVTWRAKNGLPLLTYPVGVPIDVDSTVTRLKIEDQKRDQATASGGFNVPSSGTIGPISHGGILPSTDIEFNQRSFDFTPTSSKPRKLLSGRYYGTVGGGTPSTTAGAVGVFSASPIYIPNDTTLDRIEMEVTTLAAAGGVVRLQIYASNPDLKPVDPILDAGLVAADGTLGVKSITIAQPLTPGEYWVKGVPQVAACSYRIIGFGSVEPVAGTSFSPGGNAGYNCYTGSGDTGTATTLSTSLAAASGAMKIMVRAA